MEKLQDNKQEEKKQKAEKKGEEESPVTKILPEHEMPARKKLNQEVVVVMQKFKKYPGKLFSEASSMAQAKIAIQAKKLVVSCYKMPAGLFKVTEQSDADKVKSLDKRIEIPGYGKKAVLVFFVEELSA